MAGCSSSISRGINLCTLWHPIASLKNPTWQQDLKSPNQSHQLVFGGKEGGVGKYAFLQVITSLSLRFRREVAATALLLLRYRHDETNTLISLSIHLFIHKKNKNLFKCLIIENLLVNYWSKEGCWVKRGVQWVHIAIVSISSSTIKNMDAFCSHYIFMTRWLEMLRVLNLLTIQKVKSIT